mmetsp:Transcript_14420/g.16606  ORF Transcript_14420/g.16606 Transcript_14420/m.16606 type:complete len:116 (-) Transcript_14420:239-586(-)
MVLGRMALIFGGVYCSICCFSCVEYMLSCQAGQSSLPQGNGNKSFSIDSFQYDVHCFCCFFVTVGILYFKLAHKAAMDFVQRRNNFVQAQAAADAWAKNGGANDNDSFKSARVTT